MSTAPNPQAEDGHIDIANTIVEALCRTQLSGYESRVLWALFRKTYGWHKKEDRISLSQFQELTGLPIPKISNTLNRLVLRKMVRVAENGNGKVKTYGFQKVFTLWQELPEKAIPKTGIPEKGITEKGGEGLPKSASTKETITKENNNRVELHFREVFGEREEYLKRLYPHVDFEVEKETCIAYHRKNPSIADPIVPIHQWFKRIPKPKEPPPLPSHASTITTERDRLNLAAARRRIEEQL